MSENKLTNNVSNLSSINKQKNKLIEQTDSRKTEFDSLRKTMINNAPEMGRSIIISEELYDSNILKGSQESKRDRL